MVKKTKKIKYSKAVKIIEKLMDKDNLSDKEIKKLEKLAEAVSSFEDKKWPI